MKQNTKKAIYASYGIAYMNGRIYHPDFGWIKPLLKIGNSKTGKRVFTFSLPAGTDGTCICDCPNCYAKEGFYKTDNVRKSLELNKTVVEADIDFFMRAVCAQIDADKIEMVRIHAAGDFKTSNSEKYAFAWYYIVKSFPNVRFWTYTKMEQYENMFDDTENANIVPSILPDNIGLNYGTCADVLRMYELMRAHGITPHICACGYDDMQHCENCAGCSKNKYVLFLLHSCAEYDVKKDLLLADVAKIIESQREKT